MYKKVKLASIISTLILSATAYSAEMTVGFSQIGSESGWRAAETYLFTRTGLTASVLPGWDNLSSRCTP
ncbi:hypothetical protein ACK3Y9_18345, partial [Aeromonas caviae]